MASIQLDSLKEQALAFSNDILNNIVYFETMTEEMREDIGECNLAKIICHLAKLALNCDHQTLEEYIIWGFKHFIEVIRKNKFKNLTAPFEFFYYVIDIIPSKYSGALLKPLSLLSSDLRYQECGELSFQAKLIMIINRLQNISEYSYLNNGHFMNELNKIILISFPSNHQCFATFTKLQELPFMDQNKLQTALHPFKGLASQCDVKHKPNVITDTSSLENYKMLYLQFVEIFLKHENTILNQTSEREIKSWYWLIKDFFSHLMLLTPPSKEQREKMFMQFTLAHFNPNDSITVGGTWFKCISNVNSAVTLIYSWVNTHPQIADDKIKPFFDKIKNLIKNYLLVFMGNTGYELITNFINDECKKAKITIKPISVKEKAEKRKLIEESVKNEQKMFNCELMNSVNLSRSQLATHANSPSLEDWSKANRGDHAGDLIKAYYNICDAIEESLKVEDITQEFRNIEYVYLKINGLFPEFELISMALECFKENYPEKAKLYDYDSFIKTLEKKSTPTHIMDKMFDKSKCMDIFHPSLKSKKYGINLVMTVMLEYLLVNEDSNLKSRGKEIQKLCLESLGSRRNRIKLDKENKIKQAAINKKLEEERKAKVIVEEKKVENETESERREKLKKIQGAVEVSPDTTPVANRTERIPITFSEKSKTPLKVSNDSKNSKERPKKADQLEELSPDTTPIRNKTEKAPITFTEKDSDKYNKASVEDIDKTGQDGKYKVIPVSRQSHSRDSYGQGKKNDHNKFSTGSSDRKRSTADHSSERDSNKRQRLSQSNSSHYRDRSGEYNNRERSSRR